MAASDGLERSLLYRTRRVPPAVAVLVTTSKVPVPDNRHHVPVICHGLVADWAAKTLDQRVSRVVRERVLYGGRLIPILPSFARSDMIARLRR